MTPQSPTPPEAGKTPRKWTPAQCVWAAFKMGEVNDAKVFQMLIKSEKDLAAAQSECQRLREALEKIATWHKDGNPAIINEFARNVIGKGAFQ